MTLKRKLKTCKTCEKECFLFSNGNCRKCDSKLKVSKSIERESRKKVIPLTKLKKDARYWFQRWIRLRDLGNSCCYGSEYKLENIKLYDACHYLKFELYPEAGFDEDNVHGGSKGGNIRDDHHQYRRWLLANKGEEFLNNLENKYVINRQTRFKFSREDLQSIITKYKTLCKIKESQ